MPHLLRILIAAFFLFAAGTLHAEVDGHTLLKYQLEAEAVNAEKAEANRYLISYLPQLGAIFCAQAHVVSH